MISPLTFVACFQEKKYAIETDSFTTSMATSKSYLLNFGINCNNLNKIMIYLAEEMYQANKTQLNLNLSFGSSKRVVRLLAETLMRLFTINHSNKAILIPGIN